MDSEHPARCENCKHFRYDETDMSTIKQGRCHRYPPAKDMNDLPRVKPGSVCGEWTPKGGSSAYPQVINMNGGKLTIDGLEIEAEDGSGATIEISPDDEGRIGRALTNIPPGSTFVLDLNQAVKPIKPIEPKPITIEIVSSQDLTQQQIDSITKATETVIKLGEDNPHIVEDAKFVDLSTEIGSDGDVYASIRFIGKARKLTDEELSKMKRIGTVLDPVQLRPVRPGFDPYAPTEEGLELEDAKGRRYELVGIETWKEHREPKPEPHPTDRPKGSKPSISIGEGLSGSCDCPACRQLRTVAKAQSSESIVDSICVVKCDCGRCKIARILGAHDAMFKMIADRASEEQAKKPIQIDRIEDGKAYIGERMIGEVVSSDMMGRAGYKTCKVNTKGATEI